MHMTAARTDRLAGRGRMLIVGLEVGRVVAAGRAGGLALKSRLWEQRERLYRDG